MIEFTRELSKINKQFFALKHSTENSFREIEGWYQLSRTNNVFEFEQVLAQRKIPSFNFVVMDSMQNIGYFYHPYTQSTVFTGHMHAFAIDYRTKCYDCMESKAQEKGEEINCIILWSTHPEALPISDCVNKI